MIDKAFAFGTRYDHSRLEESLGFFNQWKPECNLVLPSEFPALPIGGMAALIQAIATWSKLNPQGKLVVDAEQGRNPERLVASDPGLVASIQAPDVVASTDRLSIWSNTYSAALRRLTRISSDLRSALVGSNAVSQHLLMLAGDDTT